MSRAVIIAAVLIVLIGAAFFYQIIEPQTMTEDASTAQAGDDTRAIALAQPLADTENERLAALDAGQTYDDSKAMMRPDGTWEVRWTLSTSPDERSDFVVHVDLAAGKASRIYPGE